MLTGTISIQDYHKQAIGVNISSLKTFTFSEAFFSLMNIYQDMLHIMPSMIKIWATLLNERETI